MARGAAKNALRSSGARHTTFIWRGVLLHYGLTDHGVWTIADGHSSEESGWYMVTRDPFTNAEPFPEYGIEEDGGAVCVDPTKLTDRELIDRMMSDDREDNPWRNEYRRRHPRDNGREEEC
jgi:hypothetical protein